MSADSDNLAFVRASVDAWNANDWGAMESFFHPDATVLAPEGWPEAADLHGWPAIRSAFERLKEAWEDEHVEIVDLTENGDRVLLANRWLGHGQSSGLELDLLVWNLYVIEDGLIVRQEYFLEAGPARRAAGLED